MSESIKYRWFFLDGEDLGNTPHHLRGKQGEKFLTEKEAKKILRSKAKEMKKILNGPYQFTTPAPAK